MYFPFFRSKIKHPPVKAQMIVAIAIITLFVGLFVYRQMQNTQTLVFAGETFRVRVADTAAERTGGLSNTDPLDRGQGMLFVFPTAGVYGFWMKDMRYALDIIWIRNGQIVDLTSRVAPPDPNTPDAKIQIYRPRLPIDRVLEISAGEIERLRLKIGDRITELK